jgi:hypothetical protein
MLRMSDSVGTHSIHGLTSGDLRRYFKRYILLAMGTLLIGVLLLIFIPRFFYDRQPADFRIDHSRLIILNKSGKELWTYDTKLENLMDEKLYRDRFQVKKTLSIEVAGSVDSFRAQPSLIIRDIDGCGKNEVLFAPQTTDDLKVGNLLCFNYRKKLLWEFRSGREIKFGQKIYPPAYAITGFLVDDLNNDGRNEITVISHCRHESPTQVTILDIHGQSMGEYWNFGQFVDFDFSDLNGDGTKEILLGGQNNDYQQPVLVVLDSRPLSGGSPQSKSLQCEELPPGSEKYYVRLPLSELELINSPGIGAKEISIYPDRQIQAELCISSLIFNFNFDLEIGFITFSHRYQQLYKDALFQSKIKAPLDMEKLRLQLMKSILYFDGATKTWVNHPAMSNPW